MDNIENKPENINTPCERQGCSYMVPSLDDIGIYMCDKCNKLVLPNPINTQQNI